MRITLQKIVTLALGFGLLATSSPALARDIAVELDNRRLQFDQPPLMLEGRLMVPLRGIFEALQADVLYDAATRSIKATKGDTVVQLQLGSRTALINGQTSYLDVPANTIGGRTMVPLRFVSESLGAEVKWDGATQTVRLFSDGSASTAPGPGSTSPSTDSGAPPRVDRVIHNATEAMAPGQVIEVIVYGEPGGQASFEILGATRPVSLPEVSSGRYQTRYTIPRGLQVEQGVLVATLRKNGREMAQEAQRTITVRDGKATSPQPDPTSVWQAQPAADSTVAAVRPQVSLNFPENVRAETVRLFVDGVNFSNQASLQNRRLTWRPTYDLSSGRHEVEVQAVANSGNTLSHSWFFTIEPSSGAQTGQVQNFTFEPLSAAAGQTVVVRLQAPVNSSGTFTVGNSQAMALQQVRSGEYEGRYTVRSQDQGTLQVRSRVRLPNGQIVENVASNQLRIESASTQLSVANIRNGMALPPVFNVQGQTAPGATVTVVAEYSSGNLLEGIVGASRRLTNSVTAGSSGHFDVPFDGSSIPSGQQVRLTVSDNRNSPPVVLSVTRQ